jgi:hypothetical protein
VAIVQPYAQNGGTSAALSSLFDRVRSQQQQSLAPPNDLGKFRSLLDAPAAMPRAAPFEQAGPMFADPAQQQMMMLASGQFGGPGYGSMAPTAMIGGPMEAMMPAAGAGGPPPPQLLDFCSLVRMEGRGEYHTYGWLIDFFFLSTGTGLSTVVHTRR